MLVYYRKANEIKRRGEKNIQNKAVQTKLSLYIVVGACSEGE